MFDELSFQYLVHQVFKVYEEYSSRSNKKTKLFHNTICDMLNRELDVLKVNDIIFRAEQYVPCLNSSNRKSINTMSPF